MVILVTVAWGELLGGAETMLDTLIEPRGPGAEGPTFEFVFFEDGPWPASLRAAGFHVEIVPTGRLRDLGRLAASIVRLSRILRRRRPDVVLSWMPKTQLYTAPAAVLAGMRGRTIWWQHGIPSGHWMDRAASILPAVAVGCSSRAAAEAQAAIRPRRRTFVVTPGIPEPAVTPAPDLPAALPSGVPVVGIVGRLQPWKGQDRVLAAQAILRDRGVGLHLLIVGGDAYGLSSEYAESLPRLVGELGLQDAVTMAGQVPEAGPYIEQMDILVNASEGEPFGIVLLEGMARGVAVLAVDSGGPAEIIESGRTGMLVDSGSPADLADGLEILLRSPELRAELASGGRERYRRAFTAEAMRDTFARELELCADGSALGPPLGEV